MKTVIKTIHDDLDSQNRRFVWTLFSDGSAMSREITHHSTHAGSMKETWREEYPAGSEMAEMISAMK
jgi:hypothetical protein